MRFKTSGFLKQVCKVKDILSIREWFDESEPVLSSSIFKSPFGECCHTVLVKCFTQSDIDFKKHSFICVWGSESKKDASLLSGVWEIQFHHFRYQSYLFYHKTFANKNYFSPPWYFELMVREICIEFCFVDT